MNKLLAAIVLLAVSMNAQAQKASTESVEKLLQLTGASKTIESMYGPLEKMMRQIMVSSLNGRQLSESEQTKMDNTIAKVLTLVKKEYSFDVLKPQYIQIYSEVFDQTEIDGLISFYSSPIGKTFVTKMPILMEKSMAVSQAQLQSYLPKLSKIVEEEAGKIVEK